MALDVPAVLPLDVHQRRAQWQQAIVLLALVSLAGPSGAPEPATAGTPRPPARARAVAPSPVRRGRRTLRPPRSC